MKIVIPHPIQAVAAFTLRQRHLGFLQIVLGDQNDRTPARGLTRSTAQCADNVFFGVVANGVRRVEPEAIEMKFLDPIASVGDEELANWL